MESPPGGVHVTPLLLTANAATTYSPDSPVVTLGAEMAVPAPVGCVAGSATKIRAESTPPYATTDTTPPAGAPPKVKSCEPSAAPAIFANNWSVAPPLFSEVTNTHP